MSLRGCSRLSANTATDSSDWRCSRTLEDSGCRFHGSSGADPYTMTPDFQVPAEEKLDDRLQRGEETEVGTGDARRTKRRQMPKDKEKKEGLGTPTFPTRKRVP
ncbi:hypothetical protein NDU88_004029 [Pleurodeles waltl]|uniref:Uncharacterized protein n=1 Tax=Pleurodeles waltl TaxID=8319 RepID=A0AAV7WQQ6_PLEWA|nr:hypothetical protein NDU88_004029 [Pleurodeles waltl]